MSSMQERRVGEKVRTTRVTLVALGVMTLIGVVAGCEDESGGPTDMRGGPNDPRLLRFAPSCGKEGDTITVSFDRLGFAGPTARCDDAFEVRFSPNIAVPGTGNDSEGDGHCRVDAIVPAGATTGTIVVARRRPGTGEIDTQASERVYAIPCPPDGGGDADASDPSHVDPTDAGDAEASTACVPEGTATRAPTGQPSPSKACGGARIFWSGGNLGTKTCGTIGGHAIESVPDSGQWFIVPKDIPPGDYTMTVRGPGGSVSAPFTVTPGVAPAVTSTSPSAAAVGAEVTLTGEGLIGIPFVTLAPVVQGQPSANPNVKTSNGTTLTFDVPNLAAGSYRITVYKADCGMTEVDGFTIQ